MKNQYHHPKVYFLLIATLSFYSVFSQSNYSIREINPTTAALDASDPDGASGGRINGLGISSDGNTVYAASEFGGIWKSTDRGLNWFKLTNHRPQVTWDVEVDPSDNNHVLATSHYDGRATNSRSGLNRSTNGGTSWSKPASFVPPAGFCDNLRLEELAGYGISIDPDDPDHICVGTSCGLARSTDGGATWTFIDPTPADAADNVYDVKIHHNGIIDLVGDDGHRRSEDGGTTWTTAPAGNQLFGGVSSITCSPDENYVLYAVVGTSLFESVDEGQSWNSITNPRSQGRIPFVETNQRSGSTYDLWFGDVQLHRCSCTTPSPANPGGGRRCPQNTWTGPFTRSVGGHDDTGAILFDPGSSTDACPLIFSSDGGVYVNQNTTHPNCQSPSWEQPNSTPRGLWLMGMNGAEIAGSPDEFLYFGCQDNGTFGTNTAGTNTPTWVMADCCDAFDIAAETDRIVNSVCCFNQAPANRLFVRGAQFAGGGALSSGNSPPGTLRGFKPIDAIDNFGDDDYVVITSSGVFMTNNIGAASITWTPLGASSTPANGRGVKASISGGNPSFIVQAGNCTGKTQDQLWRFDGTTASGTWTQIQPPGNTGGFGIFDVDPNNADRIIASHLRTNQVPQMILTEDGGATWTNLTALDDMMTAGGTFKYTTTFGASGLLLSGINGGVDQTGYVQPSLVAMSPHHNLMVAGAIDAGVFFSLDNGVSWTRVTYPSTFFRYKINNSGPITKGPYRFYPFYRPQVPRPWFAYFEKPVSTSILRETHTIYIGTQGRGVWRLSVDRFKPVSICNLIPRICRPIEFNREFIVPDIPELPWLGWLDIPDICKLVIDCPGCNGSALCPPYYLVYLEGLDYRAWDLAITTIKGEEVAYEVSPYEKGLVISFRPEKKQFRENNIGDFRLYIGMNEKGKPGTYKIRYRLESAQLPFLPKMDLNTIGEVDDFGREPEM